MSLLTFQVLLQDLESPVCIGVFNNDGFGQEAAFRKADLLRRKLNRARIKFAAVDYEPPIKIFVAKSRLRKVKKAGITFTVFDAR